MAVCALLALGAVGCASSHIVRPLGKGNGDLNISLGGPFVTIAGVTTPVPIASVGGAYGVRDDMELSGHVDLTALAFGIVHVDPGFVLHPIIRDKGWVPTVTVGAALHLLTNFQDFRGVPQLTVAAAWRIARKHLVYLGADLGFGFEPHGFTPIWGPFLGGEARVARRLGLSLELKLTEPQYDVRPLAPAWVSPDDHGFLSLLIGINVYLGDVK